MDMTLHYITPPMYSSCIFLSHKINPTTKWPLQECCLLWKWLKNSSLWCNKYLWCLIFSSACVQVWPSETNTAPPTQGHSWWLHIRGPGKTNISKPGYIKPQQCRPWKYVRKCVFLVWFRWNDPLIQNRCDISSWLEPVASHMISADQSDGNVILGLSIYSQTCNLRHLGRNFISLTLDLIRLDAKYVSDSLYFSSKYPGKGCKLILNCTVRVPLSYFWGQSTVTSVFRCSVPSSGPLGSP